MLLHRLVFLLSFAMSLVSAEDFLTVEGMEIRPEVREVNEPSCGDKYTLASCFSTYCGKSKFCAVEFDKKTGGCFTIKNKYFIVMSMLLKTGVLIQPKKGKAVAVTKGFELIRNSGPEGLWPFDNASKGVNIGTKGSIFNWNTTGLFWDSPGPRGSLKYARLTDENRANLDMVVGGKRLISSEKAFTMSLWVRSEVVGKNFPIFGSRTRSKFYWSFLRHMKQLRFYAHLGDDKYQFQSKLDKPFSIANWSHIALVYEENGGVTFYRNAELLPLETQSDYDLYGHDEKGVILPTQFDLGFYYSPYSKRITERFIGRMACLAIFNRALTNTEIEIMKKSCP